MDVSKMNSSDACGIKTGTLRQLRCAEVWTKLQQRVAWQDDFWACLKIGDPQFRYRIWSTFHWHGHLEGILRYTPFSDKPRMCFRKTTPFLNVAGRWSFQGRCCSHQFQLYHTRRKKITIGHQTRHSRQCLLNGKPHEKTMFHCHVWLPERSTLLLFNSSFGWRKCYAQRTPISC